MNPPRRRFTKEEAEILRHYDTPEKVQIWLNGLPYNFKEGKEETWRSFRGVVRHGEAHCFEGAVSAAAVLGEHGWPPLLMCMEAADIDHNMFVYRRGGKFGSVAKSRDPCLVGRPPVFRTLRSLVLSYYPYYYNYFTNDLDDLTLRGYAVIDLSSFRQDWITAEGNLTFLVDHLWNIRYRKLFPEKPEIYEGFPLFGKNEYTSPKPA
jgi:hypothetical protein